MDSSPLRASLSPITSAKTSLESTTSTHSSVPSAKDLGVPLISEAEILRTPPLSALCFRSLDATLGPDSILGDNFAAELAESLHITHSRLGTKPDLTTELMCLRAMLIDVYCMKFAESHQNSKGCTILNLTTGLDTRFMRLKPRPHVRWVEVDTPRFTHFRQRVFPPASTLYGQKPEKGATAALKKCQSRTSLAPTILSQDSYVRGNENKNNNVIELAVANIADTDSWLHQVPADRPTLVLMEASAWTTPRADFDHIMRTVVDYFPSGRLVFDVMSRLNALMFKYKAIPPIRMFTFKIQWHCEDPTVLGAEIHPKIKFLEKKGYHEAMTDDNEEWMPNFYGGKLRTRFLTKMPGFGNNLRIFFYEF